MTENLAGRGEGLAGLVRELRAIVGLNVASKQFEVLETALEAAAPAGTPEQWKVELLSAKGNWSDAVSPHFDTWEAAQERANELAAGSGLGVKFRVVRAALATPSAQAPAEPMCECTRGLDGTLVTMNCERHKRLVVPAATQKQSAGSGALREALQKWQRKYFSAGISHEMWPKAVEHAFEAGWLSALSLSSPIEPSQCKCYEYVPDQSTQYADVMTGGDGKGWTVTEDCPIHRKAQASSEIREQIQAVLDRSYYGPFEPPSILNDCHDPRKGNHGYQAEQHGWGASWHHYKGVCTECQTHLASDIAGALAPSRQGAAKRVEG